MAVHSRTRATLAAIGAVVAAGIVVLSIGGPLASAGGPEVKGDPTNTVVTWEATPSPAPTKGAGAMAPQAVATPIPSSLDYIGFSKSCRFFNTKVAGGTLKAGVVRDLPVLDANLATGLGPCGIPAGVKGVLVSLATYKNTPAAAGNLRAGIGGVSPTQVVLQYAKYQAVAGLAFVPVSATGKVRVLSSATTHAWGDIEGYFVAPPEAPSPTPTPTPSPTPPWRSTWGRVTADGLTVTGYGITSVTKSSSYAGDYYIYFNHTVSPGCAASVLVEDSTTRSLGYVSSTYLYVDLRNYASTAEQDGTFEFVINCTP